MKLRYYLRGLGIGVIVTALLMGYSGGQQNMTDEQIRQRAEDMGMIGGSVLSAPSSPGENGSVEQTDQNTSDEDTSGPEDGSGEGDDSEEDDGTEDEDPDRSITSATAVVSTQTVTPSATAGPTGAAVSTPTAAVTPTTVTVTPAATAVPTRTVTATPTPTRLVNVTPTAAPTRTVTVTPTAVSTPTPTSTPSPTPTATEETVIITIRGGDSSVSVSRAVAAAGLAASSADFDAFLCSNGYDKRLAVGVHVIPVGATYEEIARELTTSR